MQSKLLLEVESWEHAGNRLRKLTTSGDAEQVWMALANHLENTAMMTDPLRAKIDAALNGIQLGADAEASMFRAMALFSYAEADWLMLNAAPPATGTPPMEPGHHDARHRVLFNDTSDEIKDSRWFRALVQEFGPNTGLKFTVEAVLTIAEFESITGRTDIIPSQGMLMENYLGSGAYDSDQAHSDLDELIDDIGDNPLAGWSIRPDADLTPAAYDAMLSCLWSVLDNEWKVQHELIDEQWMENRMPQLLLFLSPPSLDGLDEDDDDVTGE